MNKDFLLVTAYQSPDLDGTACAFAYAEFLNKIDKFSVAALFGTPHREAQFVMDAFSIEMLDGQDYIDNCKSIIIVDASDLRGLSDAIDPQKVIEVIDHRKINEARSFPQASIHIELVGAAATLIAEKYIESNITISQESAILLYAAIVSNTINFQNNVTTDRDHKAAQWLLSKVKVPENFIHSMFVYKSTFTQSLKETIISDFATFDFSGRTVGIAQLEILDVQNFIQNELARLQLVLDELKNERSLQYIFLTCIDLEKATNSFVVIDDESALMLENFLDIQFQNHIAYRPGICMRKEIVPLVKNFCESL